MCKHKTLIAAISLILTGAASADTNVSASGAASTHTQATVSTQTVSNVKDKATAAKAKHVANDTTSKTKSNMAANASADAATAGQIGNDNAKLAGSLTATLKNNAAANAETAAHKALATKTHVSHKTTAVTEAMLKGSTQGVASKKAHANATVNNFGKAKAEASISTAEAEKARMMAALHSGLSDMDARGVAVSNDVSNSSQAATKASLDLEAKGSVNGNINTGLNNLNARGNVGSSANSNFGVGTHAGPIINATMGGATTGALHGAGGVSLP